MASHWVPVTAVTDARPPSTPPPEEHVMSVEYPVIPDLPRVQAAAQRHDMRFMRDVQWPEPTA